MASSIRRRSIRIFLRLCTALFGDGATMVRFIQAVIGAASCVLLAAAGMALFGARGAIAGVLLAIYPPAIFLDGLFEKSILVSFFTVALLYLLSARHAIPGLLAGVALGLLSADARKCAAPRHSRPGVVSDREGVRRRRRQPFLPVVRSCCCRSARATTRSAENFSSPRRNSVRTSTSATTRARGVSTILSCPGAATLRLNVDDATRLAEEASGRSLSPDEVSSFWTARALEFIRTQPGAWVRQLTRKLALTYNAVEIADTESQDVYGEWSPLLRALMPLSLRRDSLPRGLWRVHDGRAWRRLWFLHAIALTYTLSVIGFYVFARYRFPLVPVLILFAAGGHAAWRDSQRGRCGAGLSGRFALAAGADVSAARGRPRRPRAHYLNIANGLLQDPRSGMTPRCSMARRC